MNSRVFTRIERTGDPTHTHADLNLRDKRGRKLGVVVTLWTVRAIALPAGTTSGCPMEPGDYFCSSVQVTRDGERFGASQPGRDFKTQAEREQYTARRVRESLESLRAKWSRGKL